MSMYLRNNSPSAPPNEPRRFPQVARAARLDFDGQQIWPPPPAPLDLSNYRPDDRLHKYDCGPDWWKPGAAAADAAAKREAAELRALDEGRRQFYGGNTIDVAKKTAGDVVAD